MKQITQIKSLFVNNTNQVEVIYDYTDVDEEGFKVRGTEGRVWSPTDDMASDTLSGTHPDVVKLALAYWTEPVIKAMTAEVTAAIAEQQAALVELEAVKAQIEAAKVVEVTAA